MSLTRALSNAYSGLSTSSYRADVTSNNIANASTPGYARRTVNAQERIVGGHGNGVGIATVDRAQNIALTRLRRDADGHTGRANQLASAYETLNQSMGEPGDAYGFFSAFEQLEGSLISLSATPESSALLNSVATAAQNIANEFNSLSNLSSSLRNTADAAIESDVNLANQSLERLRELNASISAANEGGGDAVAMEDERQRLLDTLSEIIPIKEVPRSHGRIDIMTQSGVFLLSDGQLNTISFQKASLVTDTMRYGETGSNLSGISIGNTDITPGSGSHGVTMGTLAGHFHVRDELAPEFSNNLDALAYDLITRLSDDSIDPTKASGAPGILTDLGGPADLLTQRGIAGRMRVNAAIDPQQGGSLHRIRDGLGATTTGAEGNSDIILKIASALETGMSAPSGSSMTGTFTSAELAAEFTSFVGERTLRTRNALSSAVSRQTVITNNEISETAVDTDAELQNLLLIEQAYAANARVIQTVGDMIDRLLQL